MRTALKKWTSVGAVVLMTGFGLAACGSDSTSSSGSGDVEVGEEADVELTQDNFFEEVTKAQLEAGSAHITMDMGEQAGGMVMEGDIVMGESVDDTAMSMTMEMGEAGPGSMEMRMVDGVLYMSMGEMTQNKFVELDLSDESNPLGEQFGSITENADPAKQLELLADAVTGFEQSGDAEQLDGVEATPYVITVDSAKILQEQGLDDAAAAQIPDEITYTMYVGPDNLPRRMVTDMGQMSLSMDYSKWGEDVTVEKPADDEITTDSPFSPPSA